MTKTKTILGLSLAVVFAVSMLGGAYASGHLIIEKASVDATATEIKKAKIDTTGKIPKKGAALGYGILTTGGDIIVATTHPGVLDSETQKGDLMSPKWHNHYATVGDTVSGCPSGVQVLNLSYESPGKVKVKGDKIEIKDVPLGTIVTHFGLAPNSLTSFTTGTYDDAVASFGLSTLSDATGLTAVCVDGLASFPTP